MKRSVLMTIALLALMGQAPAPPLRHLEYAFAAYPAAKPTGGDFDGVLSVDVLGPAPDGGTQIRMTESWYYTLLPRQSRTCEVYASGNVRCDDVPPYPSAPELALYPLLARDFFSPGSSSATSWSRHQNFAYTFNKGLYVTTVAMDLRATPQRDGRTLVVTSQGRVTDVRGTYRSADELGRFVYDPASHVPILVHDVQSPMPARSVYAAMAVDIQLMKDSNPMSASALTGLPAPHFLPHP